jgi:Inositol phosphatase
MDDTQSSSTEYAPDPPILGVGVAMYSALSIERVDLGSIKRIHSGPYITSILTDSHRDEAE